MTGTSSLARKVMALFFSVVMVISLVPLSAFATEGGRTATDGSSAGQAADTQAGNASQDGGGQAVSFGLTTEADSEQAYLTVYYKYGSDGEPVVEKTFTKDAFEALSTGGDNISGTYFNGKGFARINTATKYVTLSALVEAAGLTDSYTDSASVKFEASDGFAFESTKSEMAQRRWYYPDLTEATLTDKTAYESTAVDLGEPVLGITIANDASMKNGLTAAEAVAGKLDSASGERAPQLVIGTNPDLLAAQAPESTCAVPNVVSVTITTNKSFVVAPEEIPEQAWTGEAIEPQIEVTDASTGAALTKDVDYTVAYADNINPGTATVTVTGLDEYAGTQVREFTISEPYFTLYSQEGALGDKTIVKRWTKEAFEALRAEGDLEPMSSLYWKSGANLRSSNNYVTVADILADAGAEDLWVDSSTVRPESADGSYPSRQRMLVSDLESQNMFYPDVTTDGTEDTNARDGQAPVFALTSMSGSVAASQTAKDVEDANLASADATKGLTFMYGISPEQLAEKNAAGNRIWNGCSALTIVSYKAFYVADIPDQEWTGEPVEPEVTVTNGEGVELVKGTDYTVAYEGNTDPGTATATVTGLGDYADEPAATAEFTIKDAYLTVCTQEGDGGEKALAKRYTEAQFEALASDSADPVSGLFWKGDAWNIATAATYVTLDDLFADAGVSGKWVDSTKLNTGNTKTKAYTKAEILEQGLFYTDLEYQGTAAENSHEVVPVLSITEMSSAMKEGQTAAQVEAANVSAASDKNEPRIIWGISPDQLAAKSAAGNRYWSNVSELTLITYKAFEVAAISDQKWTGEPIEPEVAVTDAETGTTLTKDVDYTVAYADNTEPGTATATVTGKGFYGGVVNVEFTISADREWSRLYGDNRYETMSAIVSKGFEKSDWAVVATGQNYPDALAASALAGAQGCPVILTESGTLTAEAKAELQRLGAKNVCVMGGIAAVSDDVVSAIESLNGGISATRVFGDTRLETSIAAMDLVKGQSDTVIIATGYGFADTLSISPWSYATKSPIVLTQADGTLSADEVGAIKDAGYKKFVVVGGTAVVKDDVETQLASAGLTKVDRLYGNSRYETSKAVADWALENGLTASCPAIATGKEFPDALAGAALQGKNASVMVLVADGELAGVDALEANKDSIKHGYVFGGTSAVSDAVVNAVADRTGMTVK